MEKKKIEFDDLSTTLKISIVMAWIIGSIYAVTLMVGLVVGIIETFLYI